MQRFQASLCASPALRRGPLGALAAVRPAQRSLPKRGALCHRACICGCARGGLSGGNATGHVMKAAGSLQRVARSDARVATGVGTRAVAGRLAAAVDAQNGIDSVGVGGLLEGARSSVIAARKV